MLQIGSRWILAKKKKYIEKRKGKSFCRSQKELDSFKSTVSICYHDSFLPLAEIALENHVQITVLYIFMMCLQWVLGSWDLIVFFCVCCCGRSFKYLSKLYKCCWQLTCIAPFLRGSFIWQGRMILSHLCDEPKGLKTNMCLVWFVPFFTTEIICSLKVYSYALVERVYFVILLYVTRLQKYFDLLYIKFLNDSLKSNKCFCLIWVVSLTVVRYTNSSLVGVNLLLLMKKMHTCSPWRIHIYVLEGIFVGGVFGVLQYQTGYCWISFPTEVSVSSLFSSQLYSCEIYIITCELNYKPSAEQLSSMFSSCSLCYIYHLPSQMHSQPDWMMGKW